MDSDIGNFGIVFLCAVSENLWGGAGYWLF